MKTVTLVYTIDVGLQNPTNYVAIVTQIDVYEFPPPRQGILTLLGFDMVSDNVVVIGSKLQRTIVLKTDTFGDSIYHDDATQIKDATRNLFTSALSLRVPAKVTANEPVVT